MTAVYGNVTMLVATVGTSSHTEQAPQLVHRVLFKLLNADQINAAVTTYDGNRDEHTIWSVFAASDSHLACVEVEYAASLWTARTEADVAKYRGGGYPAATLVRAWMRPLSRISEVVVCRHAYFTDSDWLAVDLSLRFDGFADLVDLPNQSRMYDDCARARSDELLRAIRSAVN